MRDTLYQIFIHGSGAVEWAATALAALAAAYLLAKIKSEKVRGIASRAWTEVRSAVAEVYQTYVSELKEKSADGKLTPEEAAEAKAKAIAIAKSNIGKKGLARLLRILGLDSSTIEGWLGTQVEAAVDLAKKEGSAAKGGSAKPVPLP